jgi:hypothetical protein
MEGQNMKKITLICLMALGLWLIPGLAWANIDPPAPVDPPDDPRDTPPPLSAPTGLRIMVIGGGGDAGEGWQVTLAWDANAEFYLMGYIVYWDIESGTPYENLTYVGNVTTYTLSGLQQDVLYSAITAYGNQGQQSAFSDELEINNVPLPPSIILLGTGLMGLGLLGRRRKK